MRLSYQKVISMLDQLFFSSLIEDETAQNRAETIEVFLSTNGWDWNQIIEELSKEN